MATAPTPLAKWHGFSLSDLNKPWFTECQNTSWEVTEGSVGCHKIRMGILVQLILNLSSKEIRLCGARQEVGKIAAVTSNTSGTWRVTGHMSDGNATLVSGLPAVSVPGQARVTHYGVPEALRAAGPWRGESNTIPTSIFFWGHSHSRLNWKRHPARGNQALRIIYTSVALSLEFYWVRNGKWGLIRSGHVQDIARCSAQLSETSQPSSR